MDDNYVEFGIRKRLIEAGLKELLEHGSRDFSLRRVALGAQVSCAAPYRHFKDKDDLVRAVIAQIRENWLLLTSEIANIFLPGTAEHVTELLTAGVRFWVAGDNFAPFLSLGEIKEFDTPIISAATAYAEARDMSAESTDLLVTSLLSLMYGTVTLVISGRLDDSSRAISIMRNSANDILNGKP